MGRTQQWHDDSSSASSASRRSDGASYHSRSTAPTEYSERPSMAKYDSCTPQASRPQYYEDHEPPNDARASVETYASTDDEEEPEDDDYPEYLVPEYEHEPLPSDAIPATPRDFSELFPSSRRLDIRHDDSTIDGNMNLRVDTDVELGRGKKQTMTLFHLRMHDLKSREFSLRRYCRDSGREVCHSIRKYQTPPSEKRPGLQRSFSSAISTIRHMAESKSNQANLKRQDSGYESMASLDEHDARPRSAPHDEKESRIPTNTTKLEFSNYAHVDIKRRGTKGGKRYNFEYWGISYSWKRSLKHDLEGNNRMVYYQLMRQGSDQPLAQIVPARLTASQAQNEAARGGWIPPYSMRIRDEKIVDSSSDLSDVIIATGLLALVDDTIKRHFHSKQTTQVVIPLLKSASFSVTPKRLIDEMFHRTPTGATSGRQTPRRVSSAA